ncbi:MAG: 50S ribosomal protein L30 [Bacteroidota bacterium]|nr:50S ribosomal protein L30 [Bacteroidota bacterium]
MAKIKVTQVKSSIKRMQSQKRTLEALGLRGIGNEVTHESTPNILGMIDKVKHLVKTTEVKR